MTANASLQTPHAMPYLKTRLIVMNFIQFFIWGSWLITLGFYLDHTMHFDGLDIGYVFATAGIASIIMPPLLGYVADRWLNAERVLAICHLVGAVLYAVMYKLPVDAGFWPVFWLFLAINCCFMPTLALTNSIAYNALSKGGYDVVKDFPPIRVFGTIGFIAAMWLVNLLGLMDSSSQFLIPFIASAVLAGYSFTLPQTPPEGKGRKEKRSFLSIMGLDAFVLFKDRKMAVFFIFSMLLGAALQLTNAYGNPFISGFGMMPEFEQSFVVKYPNILLSLSQISETLFILAIPFFLKKFGIKRVMLMSMLAWFLRFGLFAIGDPGFPGVLALILSMVVYGMAFDFFNISGSIFVEKGTDPSMRSGAQGLFIFMTNGLGTIIGMIAGGRVVTLFDATNQVANWPKVWGVFALYALVIAILFFFLFHYEPAPEEVRK